MLLGKVTSLGLSAISRTILPCASFPTMSFPVFPLTSVISSVISKSTCSILPA